MANWIDDLGIPMPGGRARSAPQRSVEPLIQPLIPSRMVEMPSEDAASDPPGPFVPPVTPRDHEVDARTLIVGREVSLSGEVRYCDRLIVEGTVLAKIEGCDNLTIAESGEFGGSASAEKADVRGRFQGDLVVRQRLLVRATGHVSGKVTYREIVIERGGQISGEIHTLEDSGLKLDWNSRKTGSTHE